MPRTQVRPDHAFQGRRIRRQVFHRARQPEHAFIMPFAGEEVLCPLDAEARKRSFHLVDGSHLIAAIADVGQPLLDLARQGQGRAEPLLGPQSAIAFKQMASSEGSTSRRNRLGAGKMPRRTRSRTSCYIVLGERSMADEQAIKGRSQTIDITRRSHIIEPARRLLRAHVPWSSHRGTR